MLHITNASGRRFHIFCLRQGDRFGLDGCLVYAGDDPCVEFYDPDPLERRHGGPLGCFVAGYYASELLTAGDENGLRLNGRKPKWRLDPDSLKRLRQWVRAGCPPGVELDHRRGDQWGRKGLMGGASGRMPWRCPSSTASP